MAFHDRYFLIEKGEYEPLNEYQRQVILDHLSLCTQIPQRINYNDIKFYWCSELDDRNINAAFVPYKPDSIFLKSISNPFNNIPKKLKVSLTQGMLDKVRDSYIDNIVQIVPYVGHEMVHMNQFHTQGRFIYAINSTSLLYPVMLDKKAFAVEKSCAIDLGLDSNLYGKIPESD